MNEIAVHDIIYKNAIGIVVDAGLISNVGVLRCDQTRTKE